MNYLNLYKLAKEFNKPSGGMVFLCKEDKTVLLILRSDLVKNPDEWDIPGGRADEDDDNVKETAYREAIEEIGNVPEGRKLLGKKVFEKKNNNYIVHIYEIPLEEKLKWKPQLSWESSTWRWFPMNALPLNCRFDLEFLKDYF